MGLERHGGVSRGLEGSGFEWSGQAGMDRSVQARTGSAWLGGAGVELRGLAGRGTSGIG